MSWSKMAHLALTDVKLMKIHVQFAGIDAALFHCEKKM